MIALNFKGATMTRAKNPDQFQQAYYDFMDLTKEAPLDNATAFAALDQVEVSGQDVISGGSRSLEYVANFMGKSLNKIASIELIPPISDEQMETLETKNAFWKRMAETSTETGRPRTSSTPTEQINTDSSKA